MEDLIKVLKYWVEDIPKKETLLTNFNQGFFEGKKSCCQDILVLLEHPEFLKEMADKVKDLEK